MAKSALPLLAALVIAAAFGATVHAQQPAPMPGHEAHGHTRPEHTMPGHPMPQHGQHAAVASKAAPEDEREAVQLTEAERNFVLGEMRNFLVSVQGIVAAIADEKHKDAASFARASGMGGTHDVPRDMMRKMPAEWRTLGMDTHKRFDTLAMEADSMGDAKQLLTQLSSILANCTGCHAAYRLTVAP